MRGEFLEGLSVVVVEGLKEDVGGAGEAVLEEVCAWLQGAVEATLGEGLMRVGVEARGLLVKGVEEKLGYLLRWWPIHYIVVTTTWVGEAT